MSTDDDEARALIEHQLMEETKSYLERGRFFEHSTVEQLRAGWIRDLEAFVAGDVSAVRRLENIEAELRLRGLQPPYDEAAPEIERLAQQVRATAAEGVPEGVQRAIAAFGEARRKSH